MTKDAGADKRFSDLYRARRAAHAGVYPTEWVIRTLLGRYPRLRPMPPLAGKAICDLGFGDGRNFPLMIDAGMVVSGVETEQASLDLARERFGDAVGPLDVGRNAAIPFGDDAFDFVLACHSCYYLDDGDRFEQTLDEVRRVLKDGGLFIFSAPRPDNFIFDGATDQGDGVFEIRRDLYGLRAGTRLQSFAKATEIERRLFPMFRNIQTGSFDDDYYGVRVTGWICVAEKA